MALKSQYRDCKASAKQSEVSSAWQERQDQASSVTYFQKHEVQLTRSEHFLTHDAVGIFLHAFLFGECEKLSRHQTQQVEFLHARVQVDTDALAEKTHQKGTTNSIKCFTTHRKKPNASLTKILTLAESWHTARLCTTQVGSF